MVTIHGSRNKKEAQQHASKPGFCPLRSIPPRPRPRCFAEKTLGFVLRAGRALGKTPRGRPAASAAPGPQRWPPRDGGGRTRCGLRRAGPARPGPGAVRRGGAARRSAPAGRGPTAPTRGAAAVAVAAGEVTSRCAEPPSPGWEKRVPPTPRPQPPPPFRAPLRGKAAAPCAAATRVLAPAAAPAPRGHGGGQRVPRLLRVPPAAGPGRAGTPRVRGGGSFVSPPPRGGVAAAVPAAPGEPGGGGPRRLPARGAAAGASPAEPLPVPPHLGGRRPPPSPPRPLLLLPPRRGRGKAPRVRQFCGVPLPTSFVSPFTSLGEPAGRRALLPARCIWFGSDLWFC